MRSATLGLLALALAALTLGGCGGGSGGTTTDAVVLGKVVSVDGSTADLAGIQVSTKGDGATTDTNGTFRLEVHSGEILRLSFDDPDHEAAGGDDVGEDDDDTPDASDIDGDQVEIDSLGEGETCEIEVEIQNGEVVEAWVNRHREDGEHFHAEAVLLPPEDAANQDARGEVEIECGGNCCRAEIEVQGLVGPDVIEIVLWHPEGAEFSIGVFEVNAEGHGHWVAEACVETSGDAPPEGGSGEEGAAKENCEVPFGAETLGDLKGIKLLLVDGLGHVVLVGQMPGDGAQHDEEDHCHGLSELTAPEGSSEPGALGVALLKEIEGCRLLVIEVGMFETSPLLEVYVQNGEGAEALLGELQVGEKGMGRFAFDACPGDEIPFALDTLDGLSGMTLLLKNGDGAVLLQGEFPTITSCDDDGGEEEEWRAADGTLFAPDLSPEPDAMGWILAKVRGDACVLVIEVGGIVQTEVLNVLIVHPEGDAASLGSFEIGPEGGGRFATDDCASLPFEATSLVDLGGYAVRLTDGEGHVVLAGEVPRIGD